MRPIEVRSLPSLGVGYSYSPFSSAALMEPITCLHECCEAAAIRATCSKTRAGGGFSAANVNSR